MAASIVLSTACDKKDEEEKVEENVAVTGVTIEPTTATLTVGKTLPLIAHVMPDNATDKTVTVSFTYYVDENLPLLNSFFCI